MIRKKTPKEWEASTGKGISLAGLVRITLTPRYKTMRATAATKISKALKTLITEQSALHSPSSASDIFELTQTLIIH